METQPRTHALPEVPAEVIRGLTDVHEMVYVLVKRRNNRGQWATTPSFSCPPGHLIDGTFESKLREVFGGGEFRLEGRDPAVTSQVIVPPYMVTIDGVPKAAAAVDLGMPALPAQPHMHRPPTYPVSGAGFYSEPGQPEPNPRGRYYEHTPDQIALSQVGQLQEELQALRTELGHERTRGERRLESLREENTKLRDQQRELESQRKADALEAKLSAATQRIDSQLALATTNTPKPFDLTAIVGMVTAVVPVLIAIIDAGKARAELAVNQTQKATELQMKGIETMVSIQHKNKPDFDLHKLIELAIPLYTTFMNNRSPDKMAELMQTMGENNLGILTMAANVITQLTGENESPMMQMVREALSGMVEVGQRIADNRAQAQQQRALPVQQPQRPQQVIAQQPMAQQPPTVVAGRRVVQRKAEEAPVSTQRQLTPEEVSIRVMADKGWPGEMNTQEWKEILTALHDPTVNVEEAAGMFCSYLQDLKDAGKCPEYFLELFEDEVTAPSTVVSPFLSMLPVARQYPQRVVRIKAAIDKEFNYEPPTEESSSSNGHASEDADDAESEDEQIAEPANAPS